jgi:hypothetical protein
MREGQSTQLGERWPSAGIGPDDSQIVLGNCVQSAVKGALLGWRESASPLLEPPTREPLDAALDGQLRAFDQQRDGLVCVALVHPGHGEVDKQPKARVRRGGHGERLFEQAGCGRISHEQKRLASPSREAALIPDDKQAGCIA